MAIETQSRIIPVVGVTDFSNGLSPTECALAMRNIYEGRNVGYEPPHLINDVDAFDITDGGFQVRQVARGRRKRETVFFAVVDPGVGTNRRAVVVETDEGHTFIGPDNNVLGPALADEHIISAYAFRQEVFDAASITFHGRDIFAPTAARISAGEKPNEMTNLLAPINPETVTIVTFSPETVVHVDGYGERRGSPNYGGNVKFEQQGIPFNEKDESAIGVVLTLPRSARGILPRRHVTIPYRRTFGAAKPGELFIYEGSSDSGIELAVNGGQGRESAANKLRLYTGDRVQFDWQYPTQNGVKSTK